jgi:hypothetical protein
MVIGRRIDVDRVSFHAVPERRSKLGLCGVRLP